MQQSKLMRIMLENITPFFNRLAVHTQLHVTMMIMMDDDGNDVMTMLMVK